MIFCFQRIPVQKEKKKNKHPTAYHPFQFTGQTGSQRERAEKVFAASEDQLPASTAEVHRPVIKLRNEVYYW